MGLLLVMVLSASLEADLAADELTSSKVVGSRSGSVFTAVNFLVFGADAQVDHFYGFFSAALGVPAVSSGYSGATVLGLGYTRPITDPGPTRWFIDVFGELVPGWDSRYTPQSGYRPAPYLGVGAGLGLRFLHRSGFTLGFKMPLLGFAFGPGAQSTRPVQSSAGMFFLGNLMALPIMSLGYRWEGP